MSSLYRHGSRCYADNCFSYFSSTYNIDLKYPKLPLADTKDGSFPLELCFSAAVGFTKPGVDDMVLIIAGRAV